MNFHGSSHQRSGKDAIFKNMLFRCKENAKMQRSQLKLWLNSFKKAATKPCSLEKLFSYLRNLQPTALPKAGSFIDVFHDFMLQNSEQLL